MKPLPLNPLLASSLKASRILAALVLAGTLATLLCLQTFAIRQRQIPRVIAAFSAGVSNNPVSVQFDPPLEGAKISNIVTLSVDANSLAGPIKYVIFRHGDTVIGIVTNRAPTPQELQVNGL